MRRYKEHTFAVCAYKESPYLEECILSLKGQTVKSNIIVVTSTPNGYIKGLAEKYNLPYYINTGEGGIAQDWNFGYGRAGTRYVTIAHQDDCYEPDYLETALGMIKKAKKPLIFFCGYGEIRNGERVPGSKLLKVKRLMLLPLRVRKLQTNRWVRRRILAMGNPICCPSVTYCAENLPKPVFEPGYKSNLDWQAWERISKREGSFLYAGKPLMFHRIHRGSTTSELIEGNRRWMEDYEMFRRFWPDPVAKLIVKFYRKSESSNSIKEDEGE